MLERAAFFGVAGNLVLYLNSENFQWAGEQASRAALVFLGASYLLAPVGGWLADVYLGRFRAIVLSLLLYLVASSLLPATAVSDGRRSFCGEMHESKLAPACPSPECMRPSPSPYCAPTLYVGLLLLALAASSVRSNLTSFGADQVMDLGRHATRRFFNWFYWSINVGAVLSLLVVAFIQQNISFLVGYSIPVGCVGLAFFLFLFATPIFITKPPTGSQVSSMLKLALQKCCPQLWCQHCARDPQGAQLLPDQRSHQPGPSPQEDIANFRVLVKLLPVMVTLVPYWMVYFQNHLQSFEKQGFPSPALELKLLGEVSGVINFSDDTDTQPGWRTPASHPSPKMQSTYVLQGLHLHIPNIFPDYPGNSSVVLGAQDSAYKIPEAWLLLANVVVVLILVPVKDHLLDPLLLRCKLLPSALQKMALGMFFGFASVIVAEGAIGRRPSSLNPAPPSFDR
nr:PREDICTED: solute carrier family 15 member 3 isoform X3 [Rhinolophus sinicus]